MTDQNNTDPWASLASELGIAPSASVPEAEQQPAALVSQPAPAPPPAPKPAARKPTERPRTASDWDALASELGIPPELRPREPLPAVEERRAEIAAQEVKAPQPVEPVEPEVYEPSVFGEEAGGFAESVDEMEDTTEFTERAADLPEAPSEGEEQRPSRRRRKRRRRGRGTGRDEAAPAAVESAESGELSLPETPEELAAAEPPELDAAERAVAAEEAPSAETPDEERSRRRRSRRRRKRRSEGGEPREAAETRPEAAAGEERPWRDHHPEPSEFAPRDDADDFADEEGDDATDRELRVGHRAIPTWDEAVGLIIAKNMESRAKRPNGGPSRGGRDRRGGPRRSSRGQ